MNRSTLITVVAAAALALAGCANHTTEKGKTSNPEHDPIDIEFQVGSLTIQLSQSTVQADGSALVTVTVSLTDSRGSAIQGALIDITSSFAGGGAPLQGALTFLTGTCLDGNNQLICEELFPDDCAVRTGADGTASCVARVGLVPGRVEITATEFAGLNLASVVASLDVQPATNTFPGITLSFLECPVVDPAELPSSYEVVVEAKRDDPLTGPGAGDFPAVGAEVHMYTTGGRFESTSDTHTQHFANGGGLVQDRLEMSNSEINALSAEVVNVVAVAPGAPLPTPCNVQVANFDQGQITLSANPTFVVPESDERQVVQVEVTVLDDAVNLFPNEDRTISFISEVGFVDPNPLNMEDERTAFVFWIFDPSDVNDLPLGTTFTLVAQDQLTRQTATTTVSLGILQLSLEAIPDTIDCSEGGTVEVTFLVNIDNQDNDLIEGRPLFFNTVFGTPETGTAETDETGTAEFVSTFDCAEVGELGSITWFVGDETGNNTSATISITSEADPAVTLSLTATPGSIADDGTDDVVSFSCDIEIDNVVAEGETLLVDFGDTGVLPTTQDSGPSDNLGRFSTSHTYDDDDVVPDDVNGGQPITASCFHADSGTLVSIQINVTGP